MAELDRAHPLFAATLPVRLKQTNRDEKVAQLAVRVLAGSSAPLHGSRSRLIHVEVVDASDEGFLYTMDVLEEVYHELKAEQDLVVDFGQFPTHLIGLLEQAADEGQPEFGVVLDARSPQSALLNMVETTPFKHLTQLSLRVLPGTEAAIQEYLGASLRLASREAEALAAELAATRAESEARGQRLAAAEAQLGDGAAAHAAALEARSLEHAAELNAQREAALRSAEDAAARHAEALAAKQAAADAELAALRQRLDATEQRERALADAKFAAEAALRDAERERESLRATLERADAELSELRSSHREAETGRHSSLQSAQQAELRVALLEQQLRDKTELCETSAALLETTEAAKAAAEESLEVFRANQAKQQERLDACVAEVHRGNDVITRLVAGKNALKAKVKDQQRMLRRQEREIAEARHAAQRAADRAGMAQRDVESKQEEVAQAEQRLALTNQRLEAATTELEENHKIIQYLHRVQTEAQLGRGPAGGDPLSFSPSAPSASGKGTGGGAADWAAAFTSSTGAGKALGSPAATFGDDVADWADPQGVLPLRS